MNPRRALPAVEQLLQSLGPVDLPRAVVVATVRRHLAALRRLGRLTLPDAPLSGIRAELEQLRRARLQPLINGTGVLLHTNLGRAPLGPQVIATLASIASGYSNLEFDLAENQRGGRASYLEHTLALLCGAEAATVVNNCAAALVLVLRHFTRQKPEVVISRGELVQIGGGFRIPEILESSGARLREVGTTNRTSLEDYAQAITAQTALILKVHRSNFYMAGFVASPPSVHLAALARTRRVPLVEDLGSGAMVRTEGIPRLEHEPTPAEVLRHGVDLVTFSGDKLLGGPQAGIIAGKAKLISALKRDPFFRALRCDKLVLSALQTTVELYLDNQAESTVPLLVMLHSSAAELRSRAERIVAALKDLPLQTRIGAGKARMGGGALPRSTLDSVTLELLPTQLSLAEFGAALRAARPPVLGYVAGGCLKLDLRTIFPSQDQQVVEALTAALHPGNGEGRRPGGGLDDGAPTALPERPARGDEPAPPRSGSRQPELRRSAAQSNRQRGGT